MSVEPAVLPLPGGRPGATVVVHPLLCGEVTMPEGWVHREPGPRGALRALGIGVPAEQLKRAPVVAYLVEHPEAGPVIVDTAFGADVLEDRRAALGLVNAQVFRGIRMQPGDTLAAQLGERGLAPADIRLIVMTHLHVDHSGGLRDFPNATVVVTRAEWDAAHARDAGLAGYHGAHLDPGLDVRLVTPVSPPAEGLARLDEALDLFGDGSLRLLSTPGHSRGHVSVLARLEDRMALLAGDAIYTLATLREGKRPFRAVDRPAYEASLRCLEAFDRAHPDALVVPGHDMSAWAALKPVYR
jgi:N-acyl homoserine lactone hydrolase